MLKNGEMSESQKELYELHACSNNLKRKVERSKEIIRDFLEVCDNPYVSWSTGKDSTALLGLVREIAEVPAVHLDNGVEMPGTKEIREQMTNVIHHESEKSFMEVAEIYGLESKETRKSQFFKDFENHFNFNGVFMGLRAEESAARKYNAMRGAIYQKKDGTWVCNAIVNWTARDVFAYLVTRELPIHPYYLLQGPYHMENRRVGGYVSSRNRGKEFGRFAQLKYFYPEIYDELTSKFPELKQFG